MHERGSDVEAVIGISFMEAAKGTKQSVTIMPIVDCKTCHGSGLKEGVKRTVCGSCKGSGTRTFMVQSGFQMATTCTTCQGTGTTVPKNGGCGDCAGLGKVKERKNIDISIPAGESTV